MKVRHAAVVAGLALGLMSGTAKAAYIVDIEQLGANVIATGSGSFDLSASSYSDNGSIGQLVYPSQSRIALGSEDDGSADRYTVNIIGPANFGIGDATFADSFSGLRLAFDASDQLITVPGGYVSGTQLGISTDTFNNTTIAGLGLTAGSTFIYSFLGDGESTDTFTINVGGLSAVPLPTSAPMFGAALMALGAVGYGMKRKAKAAA